MGRMRAAFSCGIATVVLIAGAALATDPAGASTGAQPAAVSCVGAAAMAAGPALCPPTTKAPVSPTPAQAALDRSDAWAVNSAGADCFSHPPSFPQFNCYRTTPAATAKGHVAVVGNSHAGQWLSAIEAIAKTYHWEITTFVASQCAFADVAQHFPTPAGSVACTNWARTVAKRIASGGFGLIIVASKVAVTAEGFTLANSWTPYQLGYEKVLKTLAAAHRRVLAIRDTPSPEINIPSCLASHTTDYTPCNGTPATWLPKDPLVAAMAAVHTPQMAMVDLTKYFCTSTVCDAAIGKIPVYLDGSHITATYSRTVVPYLSPAVAKIVHT